MGEAVGSEQSERNSGVNEDLLTVWEQALDISGRGSDEGFLSLGAHSLMAVKLIADIEELTGHHVPLTMLLRDNASISDINDYLADRTTVSSLTRPPVPRVAKVQKLIAAQQAIWIDQHIQQNDAAYHVVGCLRIDAVLDPDRVSVAINRVIAAHDALRARVEDFASGPALVFSPTAPDLRVLVFDGKSERVGDLEEFAEALGHDLTGRAEPLMRAGLVQRLDRSDLILVLHHIISDAESLDVIFKDLDACYQDSDVPNNVTTKRGSFAAFLSEENRATTPKSLEKDLAFWVHTLAGAAIPTRPPLQRSTEEEGGIGANELWSGALGGESAVRLRAVLKSSEHTVATVLSAATGSVIARMTGEDDVVLGIPVSRRINSNAQDMIGMAISSVPVRFRAGGDISESDLLCGVRDAQFDAREHGSVGVGDIVRRLDLPAGSTAPLFSIWVNDLSQRRAPATFATAACVYVDLGHGRALFPLNVTLNARGSDLVLEVVARSGVFFVAGMTEEIGRQIIGRMREFGEAAEMAALPLQCNTTSVLKPIPRAQAGFIRLGGNPCDVAIEDSDGTLTYSELAGSVAEMKRLLGNSGLVSADVVLLEATRTLTFVVTLLACWESGVVPGIVDAGLPDLVREARLKMLNGKATISTTQSGATVQISAEVKEVASNDENTLPLSHILFTSGSSGSPKGVKIPLESFLGAMADYAASIESTLADRIALLGGLGHDPVLRDILLPLMTGGTLVIPPEPALADPVALVTFLLSKRITVLHATPGLIELMLGGCAQGKRLDDLRSVISGGEPLSAGLVRRLRRVVSATLWNAYGATESAQIASILAVDGDVTARFPSSATVPIGTTLGSMAVSVVGADGQRTRVGELGEVVITGPHLASGYVGESKDTGFDHIRGQFETGDLGRLGPDGFVHLAGRRDRRLSIMGYRVSPDEIEAQAEAHHQVLQAWAGLHGTAAGSVLTLAVKVNGDVNIDFAQALRQWLFSRLPRYAVPASILIVEDFVLNGNHKVVGPGAERPGGVSGVPEAGETQLESALIRIVCDDLGIDLVHSTNFFEGGMTSLDLLTLHKRLQDELALEFSVVALFEHPTVATLSHFLEQRMRVMPGPAADPMPDLALLTPSQRRHVLHDRLREPFDV